MLLKTFISKYSKLSSEKQEQKEWLDNLHTSPSFDFLNDPAEDIYTRNDGKRIKH